MKNAIARSRVRMEVHRTPLGTLPSGLAVRILRVVHRAPTLLILALAISACANGSVLSEAGETQADALHSSAVLFVERQAAETTGTPAHIGARFVQYTGLAAASLPDLLGTPHVPLGGATGCAERANATLDTETARTEARLLDVGPIDVRSGDRTVRLEPRRFPDLWNVVSGVIYATDGDLTADGWHFSAPGNVQNRLGGFDVTVRAPEELSGVALAEQALASGGTVTVPRGAFQVRWNRGETTDDVVLTIDSAAGADHPATIECAARDGGMLDVDATWAERITEVVRTSGATVTLHRVRTRPFALAQVDSSQIVFDFSVRGHAQAE